MSEHYQTPCEVVLTWRPNVVACSKPSVYRYAAMGGGYMHLCREHGQPHANYSEHVTLGTGPWIRETVAKLATRRYEQRRAVRRGPSPEDRERGQRIRARREALGLGCAELGKRAQLARSTMASVEKGYYTGASALARVEAALVAAERSP